MTLMLKNQGVQKVKKLIAPLKDVPDEIYDESSEEDQSTRIKKLDLELAIRTIAVEMGPKSFTPF